MTLVLVGNAELAAGARQRMGDMGRLFDSFQEFNPKIQPAPNRPASFEAYAALHVPRPNHLNNNLELLCDIALQQENTPPASPLEAKFERRASFEESEDYDMRDCPFQRYPNCRQFSEGVPRLPKFERRYLSTLSPQEHAAETERRNRRSREWYAHYRAYGATMREPYRPFTDEEVKWIMVVARETNKDWHRIRDMHAVRFPSIRPPRTRSSISTKWRRERVRQGRGVELSRFETAMQWHKELQMQHKFSPEMTLGYH